MSEKIKDTAGLKNSIDALVRIYDPLVKVQARLADLIKLEQTERELNKRIEDFKANESILLQKQDEANKMVEKAHEEAVDLKAKAKETLSTAEKRAEGIIAKAENDAKDILSKAKTKSTEIDSQITLKQKELNTLNGQIDRAKKEYNDLDEERQKLVKRISG